MLGYHLGPWQISALPVRSSLQHCYRSPCSMLVIDIERSLWPPCSFGSVITRLRHTRHLYRSGCKHTNTDALSWSPTPTDTTCISVTEPALSPPLPINMALEQCKDPWISALMGCISDTPTNCPTHAIRHQASHFELWDRVLYRRNYFPMAASGC